MTERRSFPCALRRIDHEDALQVEVDPVTNYVSFYTNPDNVEVYLRPNQVAELVAFLARHYPLDVLQASVADE